MPDNQSFNKSIFINCPFDDNYRGLLRVLLFMIIRFGFRPQIANKKFDGSESRFERIVELIRSSKYGIHDLSRIQSERADELMRMNMPFELGLDFGGKFLANGQLSKKVILILEKEPYRYQAAISDIAGRDIKNHKNDEQTLLEIVREWFIENNMVVRPAGSETIWAEFQDFLLFLYDERSKEGFNKKEIFNLTVAELIDDITNWVINQGFNSSRSQ